MSESSQLFFEESEGMNLYQAELFGDLRRQPSVDIFFTEGVPASHADRMDLHVCDQEIHPETGGIFSKPTEKEMPEEIRNSEAAQEGPKEASEGRKGKMQRRREPRKIGTPRRYYDKNICGYITKKVIRQFLGHTYESEALQMAGKFSCNLKLCRDYYEEQLEGVTGPSHMSRLFRHGRGDSVEVGRFKKTFAAFFDWFLRKRYMRHLVAEGKMNNKQAYLEYKNKYLVGYAVEEAEMSGEGNSESGSSYSSGYSQ